MIVREPAQVLPCSNTMLLASASAFARICCWSLYHDGCYKSVVFRVSRLQLTQLRIADALLHSCDSTT